FYLTWHAPKSRARGTVRDGFRPAFCRGSTLEKGDAPVLVRSVEGFDLYAVRLVLHEGDRRRARGGHHHGLRAAGRLDRDGEFHVALEVEELAGQGPLQRKLQVVAAPAGAGLACFGIPHVRVTCASVGRRDADGGAAARRVLRAQGVRPGRRVVRR